MTLREMRKTAHLRQEDVARLLDVDQGAISHWENSVTRPSSKYHEKLAKLYGVSVYELRSAIAIEEIEQANPSSDSEPLDVESTVDKELYNLIGRLSLAKKALLLEKAKMIERI